MTKRPDDRTVGEFEGRFRLWAARPPATSPQTAARQVLAALPASRRRNLGWWRVAAAAAALLVAFGVWVAIRNGAPAPARVARVAPPALPENVVQWWIDDETPVYFVLGPPSPADGGV